MTLLTLATWIGLAIVLTLVTTAMLADHIRTVRPVALSPLEMTRAAAKLATVADGFESLAMRERMIVIMARLRGDNWTARSTWSERWADRIERIRHAEMDRPAWFWHAVGSVSDSLDSARWIVRSTSARYLRSLADIADPRMAAVRKVRRRDAVSVRVVVN